MGVIAPSSPLPGAMVPANSAARSTVEGYDPKVHDKFFEAVNTELGERGFLTASLDDVITWARTGSLMWMTFGLACCAVEMIQMSMPRFDVERFGMAPRASPRSTHWAASAGRRGTTGRCACALSAGHEITPFGVFPSECVRRVANGSHVRTRPAPLPAAARPFPY